MLFPVTVSAIDAFVWYGDFKEFVLNAKVLRCGREKKSDFPATDGEVKGRDRRRSGENRVGEMRKLAERAREGEVRRSAQCVISYIEEIEE